MAKRKTQAAIASNLPDGFVNTSGGQFPKVWTPEPGDSLRGIVQRVRWEDARILKWENAKKGEKVGVAEIANSESGEIVSVFESAALKEFFRVIKPGSEIFLRLVEIKKIGKKRFKVFESGVKKGNK